MVQTSVHLYTAVYTRADQDKRTATAVPAATAVVLAAAAAAAAALVVRVCPTTENANRARRAHNKTATNQELTPPIFFDRVHYTRTREGRKRRN